MIRVTDPLKFTCFENVLSYVRGLPRYLYPSVFFCLLSCGGGGTGGETAIPTISPTAIPTSMPTLAPTPAPTAAPEPTPVPVACTVDCDVDIRINEAVSSNSIFEDDDGDEEDWFELYNNGTSNTDLAGWTLTDDADEPDQWTLPSYIFQPGEYLVIWASKKDRANADAAIFHTNFKISSKGETLFLFDATAAQMDSLAVENVAPEKSVGISADGNTVVYYDQPTPGSQNATSEYAGITTSEIVFSDDGGLFEGGEIILSGNAEDEVIRYTLDATIPTKSSSLYRDPLAVSENTVVRARIFQEGYIPSRTDSRTYILSDAHDIPVITLATEPDNFFDSDTGIYIYGDSYESADPHYGANFWEDWERDVHFAFYEENGDLGVAIDGGVKIFGGWSRAHDQRSLSIFARGRYGFSELEYPLFPDLDYDEFQALVLRNSGNDWMRTMLRDATLTSLMDGSVLDHQAFRSVAVYLNKEYWGMYNLREKVNEHFLASKHDIDADDIDLLERDGEIIEGDNSDYLALIDYVTTRNLAVTEYYQHVASEIDIENFISYVVAEIYFNNQDWPGNNIKFWKSPETKWRWILYDTEFGTGIYNSVDYSDNALVRALASNGPDWPNPPWSTLLLRRLVENSSFKNQLISQFADELNSRFLPANVRSRISAVAAKMENEIPLHFARWGESPGRWTDEVENFKNSITNRPGYLVSHIESQFGLAGTHRLTVTSESAAFGSVMVNSLNIASTSWSGNYFEGVPVEVTAIPAEGYEFSRWTGASTATTASIQLSLTGSASISPVFVLVSE
ncbi:CotH kinase family protein [Teredinibacter haidensis]|uniref:CotH kinase family protein n=1 Tax=Teredinibacter haidensis TaxID=2731755 RepID=UPI0009FB454B|nr:CotH kinase family protein [Teredinibacter haidensis]